MKNIVIEKIEAAKVVAIIRVEDSESVRSIIQNLISAGIKALEITSNTPNFCEHVSWTRKTYPDVLTGAGTVTNVALAEQAIEAGAQFLVTPNMNIDVIKTAQVNHVVTLMGAATPTDVATGLAYGADFIKIFPAGPLGIDYFKALLGPFKGARFIAVGGIDVANAAQWFAAGVVGVGVGGSFTQAGPQVLKDTVSKLLAQINE